jgi:hypothetical protein
MEKSKDTLSPKCIEETDFATLFEYKQLIVLCVSYTRKTFGKP